MSFFVIFIILFQTLYASQPFEKDNDDITLGGACRTYVKNCMLSDLSFAAITILAPRYLPKTTRICVSVAAVVFLYCLTASSDPVAGQLMTRLLNPKSQKAEPPKILTLIAMGYQMCNLVRRIHKIT